MVLPRPGKMVWTAFFVLGSSVCLVSSFQGYGQSPGGSSVWGYFSPPLTHRVPSQPRRTAMEDMVDLTNNLGVAILQDHSYSRGNFAFSPYGVASVLVVLYEGARGESARQIYTAVGFPSDKDIIRVGFRNIHRHLRSYFSHEGYLSGISLNKNSSSLKPEYKKILRFYGYDIDTTQPTEEDEPQVPGSAASETTKTTVWSSPGNVPPMTPSPPISEEEESQSMEEDSNEFVNSTPAQEPIRTTATSRVTTTSTKATTTSKTTTTSSEATTPPETTTNPPKPTTTSPKPTTTSPKPTTTSPETTTTASATTTTPKPTTTSPKTTTTPPQTTRPMSEPEPTTAALSTTTELPEEKPVATSTESEPEMDLTAQGNPTTEFAAVPTTTEQKGGSETTTASASSEKPTEETTPSATTTEPWTSTAESATQKTEEEEINPGLDNGMLIPQLGDSETIPPEASTTTEQTSSTTETSTQPAEESTKLGRNRKSLIADSEIRMRNDIKMSRTLQDEGDLSKRIRNIVNTKVPLWLGGSTKKPASRIKRTLTDYLKSPHNPDLSLQLQNGMYDTHVSRNADLYRSLPRLLFLVDGAVDTPVPMMTYTNVFPFAYIPRLHAKALEFPLDDVRYKLLILLPVERRGLRQLVYDLGRFPLSKVLTAIQPARVRAMVPTFMVEGFVILTSSLQKLGIWDVFDPRKANLSGMSLDPELYVRNVEQSVTVVIRNYVEILDIQTRTMAARQMEHDFEATHPFLYFVMDTATNAALMAGQILDPLNSRIY